MDKFTEAHFKVKILLTMPELLDKFIAILQVLEKFLSLAYDYVEGLIYF